MRLAVLQPAGNDEARAHYRDTITTPVTLADYASDLGEDAAVLQALYSDGRACLWGVTPGTNNSNVSKYARMSPGDYVFFAGDKHLFAGATVTHTFRNSTVALQLWDCNENGQAWELMFAIDELRSFSIPYAEMNEVVGYKPNNIVQGFTVLNDARSAALFDFLTLDSDLHPPAVTRTQLADLLKELPEGTDAKVTAIRRLEQGLLRRTLLHAPAGTCDLCGDELPVQFLVAAHIKKRSACSLQERLDIPAIAMIACKFGCDVLFEEGYIGVDPSGSTEVSPLAPRQGTAALHLKRLAGRDCTAHNLASADYYAWHYAHTYKQGGLAPIPFS